MGYVFWSAVALLVPCLIAGMRDSSVGTDVLVYAEPLYQLARQSDGLAGYYSSSWWDVWRWSGPADYEPGFSVLVWLVAKAFGSLGAVLFSIQLLTVLPVFLALARRRDRTPVWVGMAVYYLMFFNLSLNMMRQAVAMAVLLYGFRFLEERRPARYALCVGAAMLFHVSAALGLVVMAVYAFVGQSEASGLRRIAALAGAGLAVCALAEQISSLMRAVGLGQYAAYLGAVSFSISQLAVRVPPVALMVVCWRSFKADPCPPFFMAMAMLDILVAQLGSATLYGVRIAAYFGFYLILGLPALLASPSGRWSRLGLYLVVLAYLVVYWVFMYAALGTGQTVPYSAVLS